MCVTTHSHAQGDLGAEFDGIKGEMWFMYGIILVVRAYATAYGAPPTRAETSKLVEELKEKTGVYDALLRVVWIYMKISGASAGLLNLAALGVSDAATALLEEWYCTARTHPHIHPHTHTYTYKVHGPGERVQANRGAGHFPTGFRRALCAGNLEASCRREEGG